MNSTAFADLLRAFIDYFILRADKRKVFEFVCQDKLCSAFHYFPQCPERIGFNSSISQFEFPYPPWGLNLNGVVEIAYDNFPFADFRARFNIFPGSFIENEFNAAAELKTFNALLQLCVTIKGSQCQDY